MSSWRAVLHSAADLVNLNDVDLMAGLPRKSLTVKHL